jgi:hypothetical protein
MKMIIKESFNKRWLLYLFLIGIHILTTYSYGDTEAMNYNNDADESKKLTFESLIENINGRHRVKRGIVITAGTSKFI